jgi:AcrR family transcriptional regulator
MARVNLQRRAEIGLAKRARTHAAILEAARACYAAPSAEPVTVDTITRVAGLAKGTFYAHFRDLPALEAELGEALIVALDERLQPARLAVGDPLNRLATGATIMLNDLAAAPEQARLVAHAHRQLPEVARAVQARLRQDLVAADDAGLLALKDSDLALRIVVALFMQAVRDIGAGRSGASDVPDIVRAILRALGCAPADAAARAAEAACHAPASVQHLALAGDANS